MARTRSSEKSPSKNNNTKTTSTSNKTKGQEKRTKNSWYFNKTFFRK